MKNRSATILTLVTFGALALMSFQSAAQAGMGGTLDRANRMLHQKFLAADTDKDGYLTPEEAEKGKMTATAEHFAEIDTTHRGKVSEDEIRRFIVERAAERSKTP